MKVKFRRTISVKPDSEQVSFNREVNIEKEIYIKAIIEYLKSDKELLVINVDDFILNVENISRKELNDSFKNEFVYPENVIKKVYRVKPYINITNFDDIELNIDFDIEDDELVNFLSNCDFDEADSIPCKSIQDLIYFNYKHDTTGTHIERIILFFSEKTGKLKGELKILSIERND